MNKTYSPKEFESEIYKKWEASGAFTAKIDPTKKPFTVLLPPPNASGRMHTGNVLMIAIEDLLIRHRRMQGYNALWVPGTDHAGFETQTTFERELKKQNKSRFDFNRNELYQMIWQFVQDNKGLIENQIKTMGASVDWSRYLFMLDPKAIKIYYDLFEKMVADNLIYRGNYIVNYSFKWGTTFSDAEIQYKDATDPLYYIRYSLIDKKADDPEYLVLATVRPETIPVDTHLAVNPKDPKNKKYIGRKVVNPLTGKEMTIISDNFVDPAFGTGIVKITPAHDKQDYEVGVRHQLPVIEIVDTSGKLTANAGPELAGLNILEGRAKAVELLKKVDRVEKIDEGYIHQIPVDYRSGDYIENLILPNWFVKTDSLKKPAYEAVKNGQVKIFPKWREITYLRWMENMHDWAISRQITWGIRIPVWYNTETNKGLEVVFLDTKGKTVRGKLKELEGNYSFPEIETGLQRLSAPKDAIYVVAQEKPKGRYLQETDTFDTWFSSGQWPLTTLGYPDSADFKYFYPTDVLETGWEIVTRWVSRMMMLGIYATGQPPFKNIYLHGHIRAIDGKKMSKSLGNIINPEDYMDQYGVDALRMGLISGTANGKDFNFPHDKIIGYRNFANKLWNIARFLLIIAEKNNLTKKDITASQPAIEEDKAFLQKLTETITKVDESLAKYRFSDAGDAIYHFVWDDLASGYLEVTKNREDKSVVFSILVHSYLTSLKLLHPFMPFVTEAIWGELKDLRENPEEFLITAAWPKI